MPYRPIRELASSKARDNALKSSGTLAWLSGALVAHPRQRDDPGHGTRIHPPGKELLPCFTQPKRERASQCYVQYAKIMFRTVAASPPCDAANRNGPLARSLKRKHGKLLNGNSFFFISTSFVDWMLSLILSRIRY